MLSDSCEMSTNEKTILLRTKHELELCVHGAEQVTIDLITRISASFFDYINKINFTEGTEKAVTARGYIALFFDEKNNMNNKASFALRAHELIVECIND